MKRCNCCKVKLGPARTYGYYVTPWLVVVQREFCSQLCKESYDAKLFKMAKAPQTHPQSRKASQ